VAWGVTIAIGGFILGEVNGIVDVSQSSEVGGPAQPNFLVLEGHVVAQGCGDDGVIGVVGAGMARDVSHCEGSQWMLCCGAAQPQRRAIKEVGIRCLCDGIGGRRCVRFDGSGGGLLDARCVVACATGYRRQS
jgi:hypothetical protein